MNKAVMSCGTSSGGLIYVSLKEMRSTEKILENLMAEILPNLIKTIHLEIQEV